MDFFDFQQRGQPRPATGPAKTGKADVLSVSQLSARLERALIEKFPIQLRVRGEVSNFKAHSSGHLYFTLKDPGSCISCVMWKSDAERLRFAPQDGIELIAAGRLKIYRERGVYQLYVDHLETVGEGPLQLAFRQLCARLQGEGLFDPGRKKPLPRYPARIAIVTSLQTAALQDILKVLRRFSFLNLFVYHVPVQGEGAARQIAGAIGDLSRRTAGAGGAGLDLILLARGGGSLEDLWAFNEEAVARAIAACPIPVVSGIGHEVDVTIADLVADHHAHTPTEAAQTATQHWRNAPQALEGLRARLQRAPLRAIAEARHRLRAIERHPFFARPQDRFLSARQTLDDRRARLERALESRLAMARQRLEHLGAHLAAISPQRVLGRGYSVTMIKKTGQILRAPADVKGGEKLQIRLAAGEIEATAEDPKQPTMF